MTCSAGSWGDQARIASCSRDGCWPCRQARKTQRPLNLMPWPSSVQPGTGSLRVEATFSVAVTGHTEPAGSRRSAVPAATFSADRIPSFARPVATGKGTLVDPHGSCEQRDPGTRRRRELRARSRRRKARSSARRRPRHFAWPADISAARCRPLGRIRCASGHHSRYSRAFLGVA